MRRLSWLASHFFLWRQRFLLSPNPEWTDFSLQISARTQIWVAILTGSGIPLLFYPRWPPHFTSTLTNEHFEHNNHGDGSGYGMGRNGGRHHRELVAGTSVDPYGLMMWRNFVSKFSDLISWFPPTKVTVIYIKSDSCIGPLPYATMTFGTWTQSITRQPDTIYDIWKH